MDTLAANGKKAGLFFPILILLLAVVLWVALHGPGTDPDGLNYAMNLETGDPSIFLASDHILWHMLAGGILIVLRMFDSAIRPVPAQQIVNLLMLLSALILFINYLRKSRKPWLWATSGLLFSYAALKAAVSEDVDSGAILAVVLCCYLLPDSPQRPGFWWQILILAALPWLHKSLILLLPGYFIAYLCFSKDSFPIRLTKPAIICVLGGLIALAGFGLTWWLALNGRLAFWSWMTSYAGKSSYFWANSITSLILGIPVSLYRIFLSLTPYKGWQFGSLWGMVGLALSGVAIVLILWLAIRSLWRGKNPAQNSRQMAGAGGILLGIVPSVIFLCFWIPGYYTLWSRFLPAIWLILALRLPLQGWTKKIAWALPVLLLAVNVPSLWQAKDGEEAGRLTRWLDGTLQQGDLVILGGGGVLFDGKILSYHLGADVVMLDYIGKMDDGREFLCNRMQETNSKGRHIWLVADRGRFSSNRVISGESSAITKGRAILDKACSVGDEKRFNDPGFEDAGISSCQLR